MLKFIGYLLVAFAVIAGLAVLMIGLALDYYDYFYPMRLIFILAGVLIALFGSIPGLLLIAIGAIRKSVEEINSRTEKMHEDFSEVLAAIAYNTEKAEQTD